MNVHNSQRQIDLPALILRRISRVLSGNNGYTDLEHCIYNRMITIVEYRGYGDFSFSLIVSASMADFATLCDFFEMDT